MSPAPACAECGRPLRDAAEVCPVCNAGEDHEPVMDPKRTGDATEAFQVTTVALIASAMLAPILVFRLRNNGVGLLPAIAWVAGALVVAVVLIRLLKRRS